MLLFLLWGCSGETGLGRCDDLDDPVSVEDCRYQAAVELGDDRDTLQAEIDGLATEYSRDLLRLRLAVRDPAHLGWLCDDGLETAAVKSRCSVLLRRSHLREKASP
jgi:hypothetical protein